MSKKVMALIVLVGCVSCNADVVLDTRHALDQVTSRLDLRRNLVGRYLDYGIDCVSNVEYLALATVVSNNWRAVLQNFPQCATNPLERLLVLGVRDRFGAEFYMDFIDELVAMKTNGVISAEEFSWTIYTEDVELEKYLERKYKQPRVRALVGRIKVAEPTNTHWDKVLSGVAYTNYLYQVRAGLWGEGAPID